MVRASAKFDSSDSSGATRWALYLDYTVDIAAYRNTDLAVPVGVAPSTTSVTVYAPQ